MCCNGALTDRRVWLARHGAPDTPARRRRSTGAGTIAARSIPSRDAARRSESRRRRDRAPNLRSRRRVGPRAGPRDVSGRTRAALAPTPAQNRTSAPRCVWGRRLPGELPSPARARRPARRARERLAPADVGLPRWPRGYGSCDARAERRDDARAGRWCGLPPAGWFLWGAAAFGGFPGRTPW